LDTNLIFFLENPSRLAKKNKNQFYRQTVHVENTGTSESIFICLFFGHPSIRIFHALQQMQSFFPLISEGRGGSSPRRTRNTSRQGCGAGASYFRWSRSRSWWL